MGITYDKLETGNGLLACITAVCVGGGALAFFDELLALIEEELGELLLTFTLVLVVIDEGLKTLGELLEACTQEVVCTEVLLFADGLVSAEVLCLVTDVALANADGAWFLVDNKCVASDEMPFVVEEDVAMGELFANDKGVFITYS